MAVLSVGRPHSVLLHGITTYSLMTALQSRTGNQRQKLCLKLAMQVEFPDSGKWFISLIKSVCFVVVVWFCLFVFSLCRRVCSWKTTTQNNSWIIVPMSVQLQAVVVPLVHRKI